MTILKKEKFWVESPIPRVMRKNIKKLKKFPWLTKSIPIRIYKEEWTERKLYKFVFDEDLRQDFIDYFNNLYQEEWNKYEKQWVKFIAKELDKQREEQKINETTK